MIKRTGHVSGTYVQRAICKHEYAKEIDQDVNVSQTSSVRLRANYEYKLKTSQKHERVLCDITHYQLFVLVDLYKG